MNKKELKKGVEVVVIAGSEKGKRGKVTAVLGPKTFRTKAGVTLPKTGGARVIIEGVNMAKRHTKKQGNEEGGIIEREAPIHSSNVALATAYDNRKQTAEKPIKAKKTK